MGLTVSDMLATETQERKFNPQDHIKRSDNTLL